MALETIQTTIDGKQIVIARELVEKYNRPGPRYTSYPTAPNWKRGFCAADFARHLKKGNSTQTPLSLYFHIPFCEERCTFCACSVVATRRHEVAKPYLETLLKEINHTAGIVDKRRPVQQLHLGGGTPTYLSPAQLETLIGRVKKHFSFSDDAEISIEIDPRVTSEEQIQTLSRLGFNRTSLGLQDFDPEVQKEAGRIQSEEETRHIMETAREFGFKSVNVDLVYGLAKQTPEKFRATLKKVLGLNPDRIALFNFAYVPWMHAHQRKIAEKYLPDGWIKLQMFCEAIETFQNAGFDFIGLDHFAKRDDELSRGRREGTMYRNFQGYTTKADCDLIGMGVTSISFAGGAFAQNAKKLKNYEEKIAAAGQATEHGMSLSEDDLLRQNIIHDIFCHQRLKRSETFDRYFEKEIAALKPLAEDGIVEILPKEILVTPLGRFFLRNVGMIFDAYLKPGEGKFSRTV